tara:strand:- start:1089 stop:1325 length:237 start_codon:yes stop_codon:yes gene_type:complete
MVARDRILTKEDVRLFKMAKYYEEIIRDMEDHVKYFLTTPHQSDIRAPFNPTNYVIKDNTGREINITFNVELVRSFSY